MRKKKIAILIDLELSEKSGGHVKFWQRIAGSLKTRKLEYVLAALILFQLGSGPIRGFAITLAIGIVTSVFTAFTLTRFFISLWVRRKGRPETLPV